MSARGSDINPKLQPFKALVLAGGKGTRLRPLTYAMAKQLVPVANQPILHYALNDIVAGGVKDIIIIISPETGDSIRETVENWKPADVKLTFVLQDRPAGLAHAVKVARPFLGNSPFVMYLGDNLINGQLANWIARFRETADEASILLTSVAEPSSFGIARLDNDGNVLQLVEKPKNPPSNLALIGVYLLTPSIFKAIDNIKPSWRGELEITDALQWLLDNQMPVSANIHQGWWLDTGKKDDLLAANQVVLREYLTEAQIEAPQPDHVTIDGEVHIPVDATVAHSHLIGPVKIGRNCVIENSWLGPFTSIGDGCIIRNCRIENSVILGHCVLENLPMRMEASLIGEHCKLTHQPAGSDSQQFLLASHSEVFVP
jgi:glucose-1-phosphate thymidylyltransferase